MTLSTVLHAALLSLLLALVLLLLVLLRLLLILPHGRAPPAPRRTTPSSSSDAIPKRPQTATLAVFLGSGGHTAEMVALLRGIDFEKYARRKYVYGLGDSLSVRAIDELEGKESGAYKRTKGGDADGGGDEDMTQAKTLRTSSSISIIALPRARAVGEGKLSTLVSASKTFAAAFWECFLLPFLRSPREPWADVLVLNGPGTGVVLVLVLYIRRILGLSYTRIIYVESFARVKSLSLSAKLLRPFVDKFVVQWPEAAGPLPVEIKSERSTSAARIDSGVTYRGWLV